MTTHPVTPPQAIEIAVSHHRSGRIADAEALYRQILHAEPGHFDALYFLGLATLQQGRAMEAIDFLSQALGIRPESVESLRLLGDAYSAVKCLDEAEVCFERALRMKGDCVEALNGLGNIHQQRDQLNEAVACYQKAIAINSQFADPYVNLGNVLLDQGRFAEAIANYETALKLRPEYAEVHLNLGVLYKSMGRITEAIASYQKAISFKPSLATAHLALGGAMQEAGEQREAFQCFQRALGLLPENSEARWALVFSQLALVHDSGDDPARFREQFAKGLDELDQWFNEERIRDGFAAIGSQQPFYLSYHEENNRELLAQYGRLCSRLAKHWQHEQRFTIGKSRKSSRIRLGIVSAHLHGHSVWRAITKGWFQHFNPDRFELHVFSLGLVHDMETDFARSRAVRFESGGKRARQWAQSILAEPLDAIIFPEVGMDPMTAKLANLRLAPVQAVAWGHPETSGLPTIEYYFSARLFEPDDAQNNYTEELIQLPHLGCTYAPVDEPRREIDLEPYGVDRGVPLFICPGTPFKYAPRDDWIFVEIARKLGQCQFIFFRYARENLSQRLLERLAAPFKHAGLDPAPFLITFPWLNRAEFCSLLRQADAFLDTMGFSGFNTAMQAIECALPIVTRDGRFMRGRFASGILRRIGEADLVAASDREYVDLAVQLGRDAALRQSVRHRIEQSRGVLFDDVAPMRALEEFLTKAVTK